MVQDLTELLPRYLGAVKYLIIRPFSVEILVNPGEHVLVIRESMTGKPTVRIVW